MDNQEKIKALKSELLELESKDLNQFYNKAKSNIIGSVIIFLIGCYLLSQGLGLDDAAFPVGTGIILIIGGIIGLIMGGAKNAEAESLKKDTENKILSIKKELLELE